jgi:hypothetical protein
MKRWLVVLAVILTVIGVTGCAKTTPAPTATQVVHAPTAVPPTATPGPVVLELEGTGGTKSFTLADLKALPSVEGWGGWKSSTGQITVPLFYKGVLLQDLCNLVGGIAADSGINIIANDGYAMTISYDQVANGDFITYDPGTGDEVKSSDPLQVIVAYEADGKPLPEDTDGTLRLAVVTPKNTQIVDGHWTVKWVSKISIKTLAREWTVMLDGVIKEEMDRGTFESCAAATCHGVTWTDDQAQEWAGVPLWLLVARVDDDIKHGDGAYNEAFVAAGYTVKVIAADGYSAELDSTRVDKNPNIMVAHTVNKNPLNDSYFPLRLVGADVTKKEFVGQIAEILVSAGAAAQPTATPVPPTPEPVALSDIALKMADLKAMEVVTLELEHPKKGMQTYQGVRLNAVLDKAGVTATEGQIIFVASDGYKAESTLAEVRACKDCLVAFDGETLALAMPGLASGLWVKDVVTIQAPVAATTGGAAALTVSGAVDKSLSLTLADLKAMEVVNLELEHPKKGILPYTGVRLNALLDMAGVKAGAATLACTASDGYKSEIALADVRACKDCLLAFEADGSLSLAMPGLASSAWAKALVSIELK